VTLTQLAQVLRAAAAEAERLDAEQRGGQQRDWVDQKRSPLGNRRHCAAVRRLVEQGDAGASVVGRRCLLSPSALQAELAATTGAARRHGEARSAGAGQPESVAETIRRELRLVGGRS
jgi:hypothetical protein